MTNEVKIQHPTVQTRLPEHEQAARKLRAAVVGLPRPQPAPQPPVHPIGTRKTWYIGFAHPSGKDRGGQRLVTNPLGDPF